MVPMYSGENIFYWNLSSIIAPIPYKMQLQLSLIFVRYSVALERASKIRFEILSPEDEMSWPSALYRKFSTYYTHLVVNTKMERLTAELRSSFYLKNSFHEYRLTNKFVFTIADSISRTNFQFILSIFIVR